MQVGFVNALLIVIGLSLDGFVVMMDKGATIRNLDLKKSVSYAAIFGVISIMAVVCGYGICACFKSILPEAIEVMIACLLIFAIGMLITVRAFKNKALEERLDDSFDVKKCVRIAAVTNIDMLLIGTSFSFFGITLWESIALAGIITFVMILIALKLGYSQGSHYHRAMAMIGGMLMMAFSVYLQVLTYLHFR